METRQRVLAFLRGELARLEAERDEVVLLLEVLAEPPGVHTGAENPLPEELPVDESELPVVSAVKLPVAEPLLVVQPRPGYSPTTAEAWRENRRMLVTVLRERDWLSNRDMQKRTGLSNSTIGKHMRDLIEEGRVERVLGDKTDPFGGGRNPWIYRLLPFVEEREHHIDGTNGLVVD